MIGALGWKQDPEDTRDHDALRAGYLVPGAHVPASFKNADLVEVVDQGRLGSCTANSTGQVIRAAELLQNVEEKLRAWTAAGNDPAMFDYTRGLLEAHRETPFWSRLWAYYLARSFDHTTREDAGTNIRTIFQAINKFGFLPEYAWPYNDNVDPSQGPVTFDQMPPSEAFRQAYDQRDSAHNRSGNLIDYARITGVGQARVNAIKSALSQRHLISFGTTVTEHFCSDTTANNGRPIDPPTARDALAGGHAMCMAGYDQSGVDVVNSWSRSYGQDGWCKLSWDYITWIQTTDLWIVRRAPMMERVPVE